VIGTQALGDLVLVADAAVQKAHRGYAGEQPGKLSNLGDVGLTPEYGLFGVQAECEVVHCDVKAAPADLIGRGVAGQGVVVGDEVEALVLGLKRKVLAHSTEVVADMQPT